MTKTGYAQIVECIFEHTVEPPQDNNADQLSSWMLGYSACMDKILTIIKQIENENLQH